MMILGNPKLFLISKHLSFVNPNTKLKQVCLIPECFLKVYLCKNCQKLIVKLILVAKVNHVNKLNLDRKQSLNHKNLLH